MRLHWFLRLLLWVVLVSLGIAYTFVRISDVVAGSPTYIDVVVILLLFALLIAPLFSEVDILGVKLKNEVREAVKGVEREVEGLRGDIKNAIDFRSTITNQVSFAPVPDDRLKALEEQINRVLDDRKVEPDAKPAPDVFEVREETEFLFAVRYNIEKELRRIWLSRFGERAERNTRGVTFYRVLEDLKRAEILDFELSKAIRDVYSVTSPAVHGEAPSEAQLSLARDVAPRLIAVLRKQQ